MRDNVANNQRARENWTHNARCFSRADSTLKIQVMCHIQQITKQNKERM